MITQLRQVPSTGGFSVKLFPFLGHVSNVLGTLAAGGITYMALTIASANKKDDGESTFSSNALSIIGTILNSLIAIIVYIYSDATKTLIEIGDRADEVLCAKKRPGYQVLSSNNENQSNSRYYYKGSVGLLITAVVCANVLIMAIRGYQESRLLLDKYLDLFQDMSASEKQKVRSLISWLIVNNFVFVGAYSNLAFQGGFAIKLFNYIANNKENSNLSIATINQNINSENPSPLLFSYRNNDSVRMESSDCKKQAKSFRRFPTA